MEVFNVLGQQIETLLERERAASGYNVEWIAKGLPSEVYYYRLQVGDIVQTRKLILLK